ncbi:hypothetical protein RRG08_024376 [Elysia crispata]|uniref:Uncharacterized protein n=1 Tax=Elysia crispata TaxID=231223 RepID=A0AAE1DHV8_9GAST|nr:hypothetical protein RRG08_024376 [Elysia crispata]
MGKHYWFNLSDGMSCDTMFPVFFLYNGGELNAFGWAMVVNLPSSHLEHPAPSTYGLFMKEVPSCLQNAGTLSTMHIYLTDRVYKDLC